MRNKLFKRSYNPYAWEILGQNGKTFEIIIEQDYFYNIFEYRKYENKNYNNE